MSRGLSTFSAAARSQERYPAKAAGRSRTGPLPTGGTEPAKGSGLVYHAGALGDFVLSLPAIFRVARALPELAWRYWGPADRLTLLPGFAPAPPTILRLGHTLWGETPAPEVLDALAEFGVILAFGGERPPAWAAPFPGRTLAVSSFPGAGGRWVPVHQARQLDRLGVPAVGEPWLPAWRGHLLPCGEPSTLVLHPGSGDRRKNLPEETWAEVLQRLRTVTGLPAKLVLGPVEREWGESGTLAKLSDKVAFSEGIGDLLGALAEAALYLGNDAGSTHLAALLGVPTVAVFGPSDPGLWRPLGPRVQIVQTARPCAPCTAGGPIDCSDTLCLAEILHEEVEHAALDLLGRLPAA